MKSYQPNEYVVERDEEKCIRCKVCVNQCTYETHSYDEEEDVIRSKDENCVNCQFSSRGSLICSLSGYELDADSASCADFQRD